MEPFIKNIKESKSFWKTSTKTISCYTDKKLISKIKYMFMESNSSYNMVSIQNILNIIVKY